MTDHFAGREAVVAALKAELVGPDPHGPPLDTSSPISFDRREDSYGPWTEALTGEEILARDSPGIRYGVGVLYPLDFEPEDEVQTDEIPEIDSEETASGGQTRPAQRKLEDIGKRAEKVAGAAARDGANEDDQALAGANSFRPSSMALSFVLNCEVAERLRVTFTGARYEALDVAIGGKVRPASFWVRRPVEAAWELEAQVFADTEKKHHSERVRLVGSDDRAIVLELFSVARPRGNVESLVTVGVANRASPSAGRIDDRSLFQVELRIESVAGPGLGGILPYPEAEVTGLDEEEAGLDLLFRRHRTYAVGHGCAADWSDSDFGDGSIGSLRATPLPEYETPSITPEIKDAVGNEITVAMQPLAGLVEGEDGHDSLEALLDAYMAWIESRRDEIGTLNAKHQRAASRHLDLCEDMLKRMQAGLARLTDDPVARRAFQLANRAMLEQQIRQEGELRRPEWDNRAKRLSFPGPSSGHDLLSPPAGRGFWRPFQIAFILATLCSALDPEDDNREVVDLLFFPTGGGKTEAYLGLTALTLYHRRLLNPDDSGTHVLMRYTLRLLTAQQFQRAASLMCAMESERQRNPEELGPEPFQIGIWVGESTTPNSRQKARKTLRELEQRSIDAVNLFVVIRCPWCRAQLGPIETPPRSSGAPKVIGYERTENSVKIVCPDPGCDFHEGLPVSVVDEDLYERPPAMLIATVDKFARLAWRSAPRSLFGIDGNGNRVSTPPSLIIQDELHLISGPLGSMVGLYETLIEHLCTDTSKPKIVSSTATIRRFEQQVLDLFARERAAIFPPHGIEANESFFATVARDEAGKLLPGRRYVGVFAPGLGSIQTAQVRTFTSLLQAARDLGKDGESDPWWTLMAFFNSLRELGTSLSLLQQDIPSRFQVLRQRAGKEWKDMRNPWNSLELTGRLNSEEVHQAVEKLSIKQGGDEKPVDVCLASNIIEVGVDIDRLSLLTIVGQPKTTSQYIQVSGRIGRRWWERPGLVVTIYGAAKPRDRSHFEKFRSYHERLYAQVEPTSVTPFAPPVLQRAAHALLIAYVKQMLDVQSVRSPLPYPADGVSEASRILAARVAKVDPNELASLQKILAQRTSEWQHWQRSYWERPREGTDYLMRAYEDYVDGQNRHTTWPVPNSLRNVDAECEMTITSLYAAEAADTAVETAVDAVAAGQEEGHDG